MRLRLAWPVLLLLTAFLGGPAVVTANPIIGPVNLVFSFDHVFSHGLPGNPEGLAIDKKGNVYVALYYLGEIWKFPPGGAPAVFTTIDFGTNYCCGGGMVGMAVDEADNLFVAVASFDPATHGIWKVDRHGNAALFAKLPPETNPYGGGYTGLGFPNGMAFDDEGNLFVTDSYMAGIWKITRFGKVTFWLQDPMFDYAPNAFNGYSYFYGANGIEFDRGTMYVTSTDLGLIARISMPAGNAKPHARIFVRDPSLIGADGLAFDADHHMYVAIDYQNTLVRISPRGTITTLATATDGLDFPASPSFDQRLGHRTTLYFTNFGFNLSPVQPSLMKVDVGVPGKPLP